MRFRWGGAIARTWRLIRYQTWRLVPTNSASRKPNRGNRRPGCLILMRTERSLHRIFRCCPISQPILCRFAADKKLDQISGGQIHRAYTMDKRKRGCATVQSGREVWMYHIIRGCDAMDIMVRKRAERLCHMYALCLRNGVKQYRVRRRAGREK